MPQRPGTLPLVDYLHVNACAAEPHPLMVDGDFPTLFLRVFPFAITFSIYNALEFWMKEKRKGCTVQ